MSASTAPASAETAAVTAPLPANATPQVSLPHFIIDTDLYRICQSFHNNGRGDAGSGFGYVRNGANLRMTEFQAALLNEQLTRVEETINRLLTIANKLMPMKPHDPALHHELGTIFMRMGNEELGLVWLKSALREDAEYGPAHRSLAEYYERRGNAAQAAWHRQRAGAGPQP